MKPNTNCKLNDANKAKINTKHKINKHFYECNLDCPFRIRPNSRLRSLGLMCAYQKQGNVCKQGEGWF